MKALISRTRANMHKGESIINILQYWLPEMISAMILVTLPPIIDAYIVANSQSATAYGALAMATNFLHMLIKFAEAIPVAAIALIGRHNGAGNFEKCGEELGNTFWTTFILGFVQFGLIYFSAYSIYNWLNVPAEMITIGVPFLRLKSLGVLLIFILLSFIGFMRGIKNTRIPMLLNLVGIATFIFFDYGLVLGKFGLPRLDLNGSALATIIQYSVMNLCALMYILLNPDYAKYFKKTFFFIFDIKRAIHLMNLSWPIMLDKLSFAASYVWLSKMLASLGTHAITTYDVVKNLERFAFLPAMAFAQVITFLVSNYMGAKDHNGASTTIKKVLFLTSLTVIPSLCALSINSAYFVSFFDPTNKFTSFAARALPFISLLVIFDFFQVILAGALRGAGDVRSVMFGRFLTVFFFFIPISYAISKLPIESNLTKFVLIYGSHYINAGLMGVIFLYRIMSHKWQNQKI